ncbi:hypothetical protein R84B8_01258 [Treponema sp. R8-4-B8]
MSGRYPMNCALYLFVVRRITASCLRIVGAAHSCYIAVCVFVKTGACNNVRIPQADGVAGKEPEVFGRRSLFKIFALNPQFAGKWHKAFSGGFVFGIIYRFHFFTLVLIPVFDNQFERSQNCHYTQCAFIQVFAKTVFKKRDVYQAVSLCDANLRNKTANRLGSVTSSAETGYCGHSRIVPACNLFILHEF